MNPEGKSPLSGIICLWSGAIVDIPNGWYLCDGNNGTPDLTDRFIVGAGDTYAVDAIGGNANHGHALDMDSHYHWFRSGDVVINSDPNGSYSSTVSTKKTTGVATSSDGRPPYFALAYIMKG